MSSLENPPPNAPEVSVIIPAYNEERLLPGCLAALARQDIAPWRYEVIVADNGSSDRTREIAAAHGCRVLCDPALTVAGLRNLGARHARGGILAFVDADCLVEPDWLRQALGYRDRAGVAAWGSPPAIPPESTWVQRAWNIVRQKEHPIQPVDWLESMNLFVRRDLYWRVGGFDETLETCEDVDIGYRLGRHGQIISDSGIGVVHLGEARTLAEFIRKEYWRGKSNLIGVRGHGWSWRELPSLALPLYFGLFWPLAGVGSGWWFAELGALPALILFLLPSVAALLRQRKKSLAPGDIPGLVVLLQCYFLSRTCSAFRFP